MVKMLKKNLVKNVGKKHGKISNKSKINYAFKR